MTAAERWPNLWRYAVAQLDGWMVDRLLELNELYPAQPTGNITASSLAIQGERK